MEGARQIAELKKQLGERDEVIGELTIANRILKKNGGRIVLTEHFREELKQMIYRDSIVRITSVLDTLSIAHSSWYHKQLSSSDRKRPGPGAGPLL